MLRLGSNGAIRRMKKAPDCHPEPRFFIGGCSLPQALYLRAIVPWERMDNLDRPGADLLAEDSLEDRRVDGFDLRHGMGGHQHVDAAVVAEGPGATLAILDQAKPICGRRGLRGDRKSTRLNSS